jgi:hypothetical protein
LTTWIRRRVDGGLAQLLEPWHLRPEEGPGSAAASWPAIVEPFVAACGAPVIDVAAESFSPPEGQARCAACNKIFGGIVTRARGTRSEIPPDR